MIFLWSHNFGQSFCCSRLDRREKCAGAVGQTPTITLWMKINKMYTFSATRVSLQSCLYLMSKVMTIILPNLPSRNLNRTAIQQTKTLDPLILPSNEC